MGLLLGIDTGGTYTDAALVDEHIRVIASAKALTTKHDLAIGIREAMGAVLGKADAPIDMVSLSTTLATNALVEGHGSPICLLLPGYQEQHLSRAGLAEAMRGDPVVFLSGGHDAGGLERMPLDPLAVRAAVEKYAPKVAAFAVSAQFAVRNPAHELAVAEIVSELCDRPVTLGHTLSAKLDAPRRALTAAFNARLIPLLQQLISAAREMLREHAIEAPLMVVKGDGSLVRAEFAEACPVETILSGPAASVVGARHLAAADGERYDDLLISDMGGTTTDIALLRDGRPALNTEGALVGGWRTMVEAVQVHTYGLGGDSQIAYDLKKRRYDIGPRRAVPLSLLAMQHPRVLDKLRLQAAEPFTRSHNGQFVLRLREPPHSINFSPAQQRIWAACADGPGCLQDIFGEHSQQTALKRLVDQGLVIVAGFTPSDAAHVAGRHSGWNTEAARLGATIWRRYAEEHLGDRLPGVAAGDDLAFAEGVLAATSRLAAKYLVTSAFGEQRGRVLASLPAAQQELIDMALDGPREGDLMRFDLQFRHPLLGIGAPAACYYPATAELLDSALICPQHADIANAIGAVAGGVSQRAEAIITPIGTARFRAHTAQGVETFGDLEAAADWALQQVESRARELAEEAGAGEIEVRSERRDKVVEEGGLKVFFESRISATAFGRPAAVGG